MLLSDLMVLEEFYEPPGCALFFEELSARYSPEAILAALSAGDILRRTIALGPDAGRNLLWLSPQGRMKAAADRGA